VLSVLPGTKNPKDDDGTVGILGVPDPRVRVSRYVWRARVMTSCSVRAIRIARSSRRFIQCSTEGCDHWCFQRDRLSVRPRRRGDALGLGGGDGHGPRDQLAGKIVISMVNALTREGREVLPVYPRADQWRPTRLCPAAQ